MRKEQYSIFIVEDALTVAEGLARNLQAEGYQVAGIFTNRKDVMDEMIQNIPDLILIDINLSESNKSDVEGINLGVEIKQKYHIPIIYMSAYPDLLLSERISSARIIKKPINDFEELSIFIQQEIRRHNSETNVFEQRFQNSFLIKAEPGKHLRVLYDELLYIKSDGSTIKFYLEAPKKPLTLSTTLKIIQQQLDEPRLLRISNKYIVNIDKITALGGQQVYIDDLALHCKKEIYNLLRQNFKVIYTRLIYVQMNDEKKI